MRLEIIQMMVLLEAQGQVRHSNFYKETHPGKQHCAPQIAFMKLKLFCICRTVWLFRRGESCFWKGEETEGVCHWRKRCCSYRSMCVLHQVWPIQSHYGWEYPPGKGTVISLLEPTCSCGDDRWLTQVPKATFRVWGFSLVVQCFFSICKDISLVPRTYK